MVDSTRRTLANTSENCEFNSVISNCGRQNVLSKLSEVQNSIKEVKTTTDLNKYQTTEKTHGDEITPLTYDTISSVRHIKSCEDCKELSSELKVVKQELSTYKEIIMILQEEIRTIDTIYRDQKNNKSINKTMQNWTANEKWTYLQPHQSKTRQPPMPYPRHPPLTTSNCYSVLHNLNEPYGQVSTTLITNPIYATQAHSPHTENQPPTKEYYQETTYDQPHEED